MKANSKSTYGEIEQKAKTLFTELKKIKNLEEKDFGEPFNTGEIDYKKPALILGLNHSEAPDGVASILHTIPKTIDITDNLRKCLATLIAIYETYFSKNFDLFDKERFCMFWQHPDFLEKIGRSQLSERMKSDEANYSSTMTFIGNNVCTNKNYVLFDDLLPIKATDSRQLIEKQILTNEKLLLEYFKSLLVYHDPSIVVITNAKASRLVSNILNNVESSATVIAHDNIPIVLAGQVSGGATDSFSFQRLKREINQYVLKPISPLT